MRVTVGVALVDCLRTRAQLLMKRLLISPEAWVFAEGSMAEGDKEKWKNETRKGGIHTPINPRLLLRLFFHLCWRHLHLSQSEQ